MEVIDVRQTIIDAAKRHHLNVDHFLAVSECEDPGLIDQQSNYIKDGIREDSWGIFQINLGSHPEITKEQATDPVWASEWAAKEWEAGREWQWSCYTILSRKGWH